MKKQSNTIVIVIIALIVVAAAALLLTRLIPTQGAGATATDPQALLNPGWFLTSLTVDGQKIELADAQITLQFDSEGKINGKSACNSYFGSYDAKADGSLRISDTGATQMFCEGLMEQEDAYFKAIDQIVKYNITGYDLNLTSADGKTALVFLSPAR